MTYVCWAAMYEGTSDRSYFDVMIPLIMDEIVLKYGVRNVTIPSAPAIYVERGEIAAVAKAACDSSEAFHLIFIHADTGGRALEGDIGNRSSAYCRALRDRCGWPEARCIKILPRHETEAWILADPQAVASALGYQGPPAQLGLPRGAPEAEQLANPKSTLAAAIKVARGRRGIPDVASLLPAIAQRQSRTALRRSRSFVDFETALIAGLADIGCITVPDL